MASQQLSPEAHAFLEAARVGHLATADSQGRPHVVPVVFVWDGRHIYIALDAKPKRVPPERLKRVRNILENSNVALVVDRYSEEWTELGYVLVRGVATLIKPGEEQTKAVALLRAKYPQYCQMPIDDAPVIRIAPAEFVEWGKLI